MFREVLQIIPRLDRVAMTRMERMLNSRFMRISRRFGRGLMGILRGGGIAGAAIALINRFLNPLKEVQQAIDKTLKSADDVVTNAQQFNATPGELFKLQKLAQATGVDQAGLDQLIMRFQTAVGEATAQPDKQSAVREFVGEENFVKAFFEFIQALNKMDRAEQVVVQRQVFGDRQTLKMAEFLRADFDKLTKKIGLGGADSFTPNLEKLAALSDLEDARQAKRDVDDMMARAGIINRGMIEAKDGVDRTEMKRQNQQLANFENLLVISQTTTQMATMLDKGVIMAGDFIIMIKKEIEGMKVAFRVWGDMISKIANSPLVRGVRGVFGGGKDK